MHHSAVNAVGRAVRTLAHRDAPLVLAVSGGLDSMVLLDAVTRLVPAARITVATFDHRTGAPAERAAKVVVAAAQRRGVAARTAQAPHGLTTEAAWRRARWQFLHAVAEDVGGDVVTAHTEDDQVETVLMRALRGAGARGLAGLAAPGPVQRPFLGLRRSQLQAYAAAHDVPWVDDPSNADRRHLRNRVRHELLPALLRARPSLPRDLLVAGRRAAAWRAELERLAAVSCPTRRLEGGGLVVAAADLVRYDPPSLMVLWPALAARAGLALDARGTRRAAAFTMNSVAGATMPLSGGWRVVRSARGFMLRPPPRTAAAAAMLDVREVVRWSGWTFRLARCGSSDSTYVAELPAGCALTVRAWRPEDRVNAGHGMVRVKRLLAEARVAPDERPGWPVVTTAPDGPIVWIPGVSCDLAATARSGRPGVCFRCEPTVG